MVKNVFKSLLTWLLVKSYKVSVEGLNNLDQLEESTIIVANHTSFLDAVLLYAFLPIPLTFAANTFVVKSPLMRLARQFFEIFPMDPPINQACGSGRQCGDISRGSDYGDRLINENLPGTGTGGAKNAYACVAYIYLRCAIYALFKTEG